MSKIYTKTGDKGKTSLFDGTRVDKDNIRIQTYGTIDELNSVLGVVRSFVKQRVIASELEAVQRDLFDIGSRLANPISEFENSFAIYLDERIAAFEKSIDVMTEKIPLLTNFILPGGGQAGSFLHLARTIARRTERMIISLAKQESVDGSIIRYFNRLSDVLFTMSRFANYKEKKKEIIWTKYTG